MNFRIFGEDPRHDLLKKLLLSSGFSEASPADLIILSVREPFSPHQAEGAKGCFVFGGQKGDEALITQAGFQPLLQSSAYKEKNSVYTAEGALSLAISSLPTALCETTVLILGYGFLGKECSRLFRQTGASVKVLSYQRDELLKAEENGFFPVSPPDRLLVSEPLLINTIPAPLFSSENLIVPEEMQTVLIELAGVPCLKEPVKHLTVIPGKALPARFSPVSAAKLMFREINRFFESFTP